MEVIAINYDLNGQTLSLDETAKEYYVTANSNKVAWEYDDNDAITRVIFADTISSTNRLSINNIIVTTQKTNTPTLNDITTNLCTN